MTFKNNLDSLNRKLSNLDANLDTCKSCFYHTCNDCPYRNYKEPDPWHPGPYPYRPFPLPGEPRPYFPEDDNPFDKWIFHWRYDKI
jgi:hypothetical protein